jgi:hypothetical protein
VLERVDGTEGFCAFERDVFASLNGKVRAVRVARGHRASPQMLKRVPVMAAGDDAILTPAGFKALRMSGERLVFAGCVDLLRSAP